DDDLVLLGQHLKVPTKEPPPPVQYIVQDGDTLSGIAARLEVPVAQLIELNGLDDPGLIVAGTRLKLPASAAAKLTAPAPTPARRRPTGTSSRPALAFASRASARSRSRIGSAGRRVCAGSMSGSPTAPRRSGTAAASARSPFSRDEGQGVRRRPYPLPLIPNGMGYNWLGRADRGAERLPGPGDAC